MHGGPHQAVYAFPVEHYPRLSEILGSSPRPCFMGENYRDLASLGPLAPTVRMALMIRHRDLSGGVPEAD